MRAAGLPDDLEMILEEHRLGVSAALLLSCRISIQMKHFFLQIFAPALRAHLTVGDDQVKCLTKLQTADLFAAVEASMESLKLQLEHVHALVKEATEKKVQLQEAASKEPTKFSTFKAAGGTIDDFFKGLEDRIGEAFDIFDTRMLPCDIIMSSAFSRFDRCSESRLEESDAR